MLRWIFDRWRTRSVASDRGHDRLRQVEAAHRKELALRPESTALLLSLGNVLAEQGQRDEAEACYRRALVIDPRLAEAYCNLGNVVRDGGRLDEALVSYEKALELRPDFPEALYNLGNVLKDVGRVNEALTAYRRATALAPQDAHILSNLLCALNYAPGVPAAEIHAAHLAYGLRFASARDPRPFANSRDESRRLRIGYVSGDLRKHPVAQFVEPLLASHDRAGFEVYCYYNYPWSDAVTSRIQSHTDAWRDVWRVDDAALAERIRSDAIDVLIDLSGHTAEHRLPVFARKPAPVQATWLGYLNTTGLAAVDYRITDSYASPAAFDALHSERLMRLPHSQWCYRAPAGAPDVAPAPCATNGYVTFGAFSNLAKIGPGMVKLWCALLDRVPDSRLLIMGPGLASIRSEYLGRFTAHGVDASRIDLQEAKPLLEYLDSHRAVDVMLDTLPYAGGTTTCHAAWMGVPVVSMVGGTVPSRGGASVLHALGLDELVSSDDEAYVGIASQLAGDRPRLVSLRRKLRGRMAASKLCDAASFTRDFEQACRAMWQAWCRAGK